MISLLAFLAIVSTSSGLAVPEAASIPAPLAALSPYAPISTTCPSTPLVRAARGVSSKEAAYVRARAPKSAAALKAWLTKVNGEYADAKKLPVVALTSSGGGFRSLLTTAGLVQAFDGRDSNASTAGLLQGLTYQAGLSGGAWFLSSLYGNNYPTISNLEASLWTTTFAESPLLAQLNDTSKTNIETDIVAKQASGFNVNLNDPYGRLLSYQFLEGPDGGVADTLSGLTTLSKFTAHNVPFPIITALGVNTFEGKCGPALNATQYEFTPYEFGSWDTGVRAFTQTKYLGTNLTHGKPAISHSCIANFDNLGYVLGTSSNLFFVLDNISPCAPPSNASNVLVTDVSQYITGIRTVATADLYAQYQNPFYKSRGSPLVEHTPTLSLVDGGTTGQNNPIWPFIQANGTRGVDVLLVNDNSADTSANYPDGAELRQTYVEAQAAGLTRMPAIPASAVFLAQGLNRRPTFFGCDCATALTVVYLPNFNFTFPSGEPTAKLQYAPSETRGMIANGNAVATYNGTEGFAACLACAVMKKSGTALPAECGACFAKYCYN